MTLRPLVMSSGLAAALLLLPFIILLAVLGHPDMVRGLLLGLAAGMLNSLLLARKLDRVIDGRDPWQTLTRAMPRNMMMRFSLVVLLGFFAALTPDVHLLGMVAGLGVSMIVGLVYASRSVVRRWREEDGVPVYERVSLVRS